MRISTIFGGAIQRNIMKTTEQMKFWKEEFGDEYTDRNVGDFDKIYKEIFGITRTELNDEFLSSLKKDISILEIGCNRGIQLNILEKMGFTNLWGLEINKRALATAKQNKALNLVEASAFDIPFKDNFFDLVFTSGVLIHISPDDLRKVMDEIYRTAKKYIWCFEYYSIKCEDIEYRGHRNKLWKNDYLKLFLERYPDLALVKKKIVRRLGTQNEDMMFLLKKSE